MRILRLASSDEAPGRLPPGTSIPEIVAALVEDATGETVETTLRAAWPSPSLPGLVNEWLDRYQPDIVYLKVNAYWFNYLSLPLRVERTFGRLARPINKVGRRLGEMQPVARTRSFRVARRYLLRVFPGATYFTPEAVIASMQECIRAILAREGVGLVVSGPASRLNHELSGKAAAAHEARRQRVHQAMKRFCAELHVPYTGIEAVPTRHELRRTVGGDGIHANASGSRLAAEADAAILIELWNRMQGRDSEALAQAEGRA